MSEKEKDLNFLKDFSKITITKACKQEKICKANVYRLQVSKEHLRNIKENIKIQINSLLEKYDETDSL